MTKTIRTKEELELFLEEFGDVAKTSNLEDVRHRLEGKDEEYFQQYALIIHVDKVTYEDLDVRVKDIHAIQDKVEVNLSYRYIGTHLRQKPNPMAQITAIEIPKSTLEDKEVVVLDDLECHYIDKALDHKAVYTYYVQLQDAKEERFWHITNSVQLESVLQSIKENYADVEGQYGGMEQGVGRIDWQQQDVVMALVGNASGLMDGFQNIEAYKVELDDILDIEVGYSEKTDKKQKDTVGIVVMPLQKQETSNQKVVVDFK